MDRSSTAKQIVKAVQPVFHQTIPYQQAKRTLSTLQWNDIDLEHEQFRQVGALIQIVKQADPDGGLFLSSDPTTFRFLSIFI